jgi:stage V sporulation protein AC
MMTQKQYAKLVKQISPPSPVGKDCLLAFLVGGLICTLGQGLTELYTSALDKQSAATAASMTLVALSALLTGLSLYDDIAKAAGAGTLVPITGFANAISAPAVEFRTEGFILGVGARMFTIAGPVIVYGLSASVVYGIIYYLATVGV